ncbi:hypothetical protein AGMMS49942_23430 [Spirochaetia bacterium]|nr:hypothetical protein AGMMS49942_23430 [Spirochaetia bacterium]
MKIQVSKPVITNNGSNTVRLSVQVTCDGNGIEPFALWYEIEDSYFNYFCTERSDAFLIALLPWAMMRSTNENPASIVFDSPVSEKLLHQLKSYYIPLLSKHISYYGNVVIETAVSNEVLPGKSCVGTGISGGVDSSYTIAKYLGEENGSFKLTHGVCFNIGIYGGFDSPSQKNLEMRANRIAESTGIQYMKVTSNVCLELYKKAHAPIVPFVFMSGALALQKLFSVYYYSSAFSVDEFHMSDVDAAYFELLTVHSISTENTDIYSSGIEISRLEKVKYISEFSFTYDNLSVCLSTDQENGNCGRCAKCTRTMAELEALNKLDLYEHIFDASAFRKDSGYHWGYVLLKSKNDAFSRDTIREYKKSGRRLPIAAYFSCLKKWIARGFTSENRKREKVNE